MSCDDCGNKNGSSQSRLVPGLEKSITGPGCPQPSWCSFASCMAQKAGNSGAIPQDVWLEINSLKSRISALENNSATATIPTMKYGLPLAPSGMVMSTSLDPEEPGELVGTFGGVIVPESGRLTGLATYLIAKNLSNIEGFNVRMRVFSGFDSYTEYRGSVGVGQDLWMIDIPVISGALVVAWPSGYTTTQGKAGEHGLSQIELSVARSTDSSLPTEAYASPSPYVNPYNIPKSAIFNTENMRIALLDEDAPVVDDTIPTNMQNIKTLGATLIFTPPSSARMMQIKLGNPDA